MRISNLINHLESGAANKFFRAIFFVIFCAVFFFALSSCTQTKSPTPTSSAETKPQATAIQPRVTQIDDAKIKQLLKPGGKPLLVNFWATWCVPCREEFPDLVKIDAEYRGEIDFFTVSLDFIEELDTTVPKFLTEMKAEMPAYLLISADENTLIPSISKDWSGALPFTILYNEKGEIIYTRQGKISHETLKGKIEKVLSEKK